MARFIDMSGKAKGLEWQKHLAKTDWDAEMLRLEKEAEQVNDVFLGKRAERMVAELRREWEQCKRNKEFLATGRTSI